MGLEKVSSNSPNIYKTNKSLIKTFNTFWTIAVKWMFFSWTISLFRHTLTNDVINSPNEIYFQAWNLAWVRVNSHIKKNTRGTNIFVVFSTWCKISYIHATTTQYIYGFKKLHSISFVKHRSQIANTAKFCHECAKRREFRLSVRRSWLS